MQQYYALEALAAGPRSMSGLAQQVGLHQSTMTRIVEKLDKQALVRRARKPGNERSVEVRITEEGKAIYLPMREFATRMFGDLLDHVPAAERASVVTAMATLTNLFSPENEVFQQMHKACCEGAAKCCGADPIRERNEAVSF